MGEFIDSLYSMRLPDREAAILRAVRDGRHDPPRWAPLRLAWRAHTATVHVMEDALSIEGVRINCSARLAQQLADLLFCAQSTPRLEDEAWRLADVRLEPCLRDVDGHVLSGPDMGTVSAMVRHSAAIDAALMGRTGLVRTVGKAWVMDNALLHHPLGRDGACNYGFHTGARVSQTGPFTAWPGGMTMWQTLGKRHNLAHVDYSQTFTGVSLQCVCNGEARRTWDVMQDPGLYGLMAYEPLQVLRHPAVRNGWDEVAA